MARSLEIRKKVLNSFDDPNSLHYVRTHINIVDELLDNDGNIRDEIIPDTAKYGIRMAGSFSGVDSAAALADIDAYIATKGGISDGCFLVASSNFTITVSTGHTFETAGADETGVKIAGETLDIQQSEWLFYKGNGAFQILANDYAQSDTAKWGVVLRASSADASTGTNTSKYMTPSLVKSAIATFETNYSHPTQGAIGVNTAGVEVLDVLSVNTNGHTTGATKRTLPAATTTAHGVMSSGDKAKLDGIDTGANAYSHPTKTSRSYTQSGIKVVASFASDSLGHVTGFTEKDFPTASTTTVGATRLATVAEANAGTVTNRSVTPEGVKSAIDYWQGLPIYADLLTAEGDVANHPDGKLILVTV